MNLHLHLCTFIRCKSMLSFIVADNIFKNVFLYHSFVYSTHSTCDVRLTGVYCFRMNLDLLFVLVLCKPFSLCLQLDWSVICLCNFMRGFGIIIFVFFLEYSWFSNRLSALEDQKGDGRINWNRPWVIGAWTFSIVKGIHRIQINGAM